MKRVLLIAFSIAVVSFTVVYILGTRDTVQPTTGETIMSPSLGPRTPVENVVEELEITTLGAADSEDRINEEIDRGDESLEERLEIGNVVVEEPIEIEQPKPQLAQDIEEMQIRIDELNGILSTQSGGRPSRTAAQDTEGLKLQENTRKMLSDYNITHSASLGSQQVGAPNVNTSVEDMQKIISEIKPNK